MKKAICSLAMVCTLGLMLGGCASGSASSEPSSDEAASSTVASSPALDAKKTIESSGLRIEVPSDWSQKSADNGTYICPGFGGLIYLMTESETKYDGSSLEDFYAGTVRGLESGGNTSVSSEHTTPKVGEAAAFRSEVSSTVNGSAYKGQVEIIISGTRCFVVEFLVPEDGYSDYEGVIVETLDSISILNSQAPIQPTATETNTQQTAPNISVSQKNAVAKAKSYLDYSAFSYEGLIAQLEFEKFSHEDAVYGTDNCGADWNEQAAKKAASYMEYSSFSRDGLIEQLLFEGFTQEQAEYGATSVGL